MLGAVRLSAEARTDGLYHAFHGSPPEGPGDGEGSLGLPPGLGGHRVHEMDTSGGATGWEADRVSLRPSYRMGNGSSASRATSENEVSAAPHAQHEPACDAEFTGVCSCSTGWIAERPVAAAAAAAGRVTRENSIEPAPDDAHLQRALGRAERKAAEVRTENDLLRRALVDARHQGARVQVPDNALGDGIEVPEVAHQGYGAGGRYWGGLQGGQAGAYGGSFMPGGDAGRPGGAAGSGAWAGPRWQNAMWPPYGRRGWHESMAAPGVWGPRNDVRTYNELGMQAQNGINDGWTPLERQAPWMSGMDNRRQPYDSNAVWMDRRNVGWTPHETSTPWMSGNQRRWSGDEAQRRAAMGMQGMYDMRQGANAAMDAARGAAMQTANMERALDHQRRDGAQRIGRLEAALRETEGGRQYAERRAHAAYAELPHRLRALDLAHHDRHAVGERHLHDAHRRAVVAERTLAAVQQDAAHRIGLLQNALRERNFAAGDGRLQQALHEANATIRRTQQEASRQAAARHLQALDLANAARRVQNAERRLNELGGARLGNGVHHEHPAYPGDAGVHPRRLAALDLALRHEQSGRQQAERRAGALQNGLQHALQAQRRAERHAGALEAALRGVQTAGGQAHHPAMGVSTRQDAFRMRALERELGAARAALGDAEMRRRAAERDLREARASAGAGEADLRRRNAELSARGASVQGASRLVERAEAGRREALHRLGVAEAEAARAARESDLLRQSTAERLQESEARRQAAEQGAAASSQRRREAERDLVDEQRGREEALQNVAAAQLAGRASARDGERRARTASTRIDALGSALHGERRMRAGALAAAADARRGIAHLEAQLADAHAELAASSRSRRMARSRDARHEEAAAHAARLRVELRTLSGELMAARFDGAHLRRTVLSVHADAADKQRQLEASRRAAHRIDTQRIHATARAARADGLLAAVGAELCAAQGNAHMCRAAADDAVRGARRALGASRAEAGGLKRRLDGLVDERRALNDELTAAHEQLAALRAIVGRLPHGTARAARNAEAALRRAEAAENALRSARASEAEAVRRAELAHASANAAAAREARVRERSATMARSVLAMTMRAAERERQERTVREGRLQQRLAVANESVASAESARREATARYEAARATAHDLRAAADDAAARAERAERRGAQLAADGAVASERARLAERRREAAQADARAANALRALVVRLRGRCGALARAAGVDAGVEADVVQASGGDGDELRLCCVCQECMAPGDDVLALPCAHVFHRDCIAQYMAVAGGGGRRCPVCRAPVDAAQLAALACTNVPPLRGGVVS